MADKILCIIPARGGSKRFPQKNIALLAGKPLIAYAIEEAQKSNLFQKIVVSTEDPTVAKIAKKYGAEVSNRSKELASDTANVPSVCLEVITQYEKKGEKFDFLCILLPTSPLRLAVDILGAFKKFKSSNADYLMTTIEYPYSPFRALKENNQGFLEPFFGRKYLVQDQQNPKVAVHDGAVILAKVEKIKQDKTYYGEKLSGYPMPLERSIDINRPIDLAIAEVFLKLRKEALD